MNAIAAARAPGATAESFIFLGAIALFWRRSHTRCSSDRAPRACSTIYPAGLGASGAKEPNQKEKSAQRMLSLGYDCVCRYAIGRTLNPLHLVAELDEGQRDGVEEEHCAYDAADGPSQKP
jgi:hypothetical protein